MNKKDFKSRFVSKKLCPAQCNFIIDKLYADFASRTCENCKFFIHEQGLQPDGMGWETLDCEQGNWIGVDIEYKKISCIEWESKKQYVSNTTTTKT